jgi:hypothetical protein
MTTRFVTAVMVVILATSPTYAEGQSQSLGELQNKLRIGDRIKVIDGNRTTVDGRFDGVSGSSLRLILKGVVVEFPETQIYQIRKHRQEPDGVLIGLGIGALVGVTYVRLYCRGSSEHGDCLRAGSLVIGVPTAAAGALIDLGFKRFETIFERVIPSAGRLRISPMLAGRQGGIVMTLVF